MKCLNSRHLIAVPVVYRGTLYYLSRPLFFILITVFHLNYLIMLSNNMRAIIPFIYRHDKCFCYSNFASTFCIMLFFIQGGSSRVKKEYFAGRCFPTEWQLEEDKLKKGLQSIIKNCISDDPKLYNFTFNAALPFLSKHRITSRSDGVAARELLKSWRTGEPCGMTRKEHLSEQDRE